MSWFKASQVSLSQINEGDTVSYRMGVGSAFPEQQGKVLSVGQEYFEVVDPSNRRLRVYPNQVTNLVPGQNQNQQPQQSDASLTHEQWQAMGMANGWLS